MAKRKRSGTGIAHLRPTVASADERADRSFWQYSSETQRLPSQDNRHRVTPSARFYVVQLIGTWVNVSESAERTIHYRNCARWVTFERKQYQLRKATEFREFVGRFLANGCYGYVGGVDVYDPAHLRKLKPQPFIYIASTAALRAFRDVAEQHRLKKERS